MDEGALSYLESYRFSGDIWGYGEGDCYFPGSPILVVEAPFAEAVVLETLALSILNHDSAIASAASRMVNAADGRPIIEMGSRRTHELAAVASARAAYLAGFGPPPTWRPAGDYGIPTSGTSAHAFTLVHDSERDAFAAQLAALGKGTTLLVDTFDVASAVRTAMELAGPGPRRGPHRQRRSAHGGPAGPRAAGPAGRADTRIVLSGDLNEYSIAALAAAPVDGYGVGTSLVTGSGAPTAALVYKLVARAREANGEGTLEPVAKRSVGKPGRGGRKWAARQLDENGVAIAELITRADTAAQPGGTAAPPCCGRWCGTARSSAGSRWTRRGSGTARRWPNCPCTHCSCPGATRPSRRFSCRTTSKQPSGGGQGSGRGTPQGWAQGDGAEFRGGRRGVRGVRGAAAVRHGAAAIQRVAVGAERAPVSLRGGAAPGAEVVPQRGGVAEPGPVRDQVDRRVVSSSSSWASRMRWPVSQRSGVVPVSCTNRRAKVRSDMRARAASWWMVTGSPRWRCIQLMTSPSVSQDGHRDRPVHVLGLAALPVRRDDHPPGDPVGHPGAPAPCAPGAGTRRCPPRCPRW